MKNVRQILIIFIALFMLVLPLNGCSKNNNEPSKTQNSANGTNVPDKIDPYKFNIKNLSIFAAYSAHAAQTGKSYNDNEVFKELENITGVKVEWIHPPANQTQERLTLIFASSNYPDLIMTNWQTIAGGASKYAKDGSIIKLNDLVDKYAPDVKKLIGSNPNYTKGTRDAEGSLYYIPEYITEMDARVYVGPIIREDWLKKLNLEMPKTIDQLYTTLKAFKERDPNGNGKADEIPYSGTKFRTETFAVGKLLWAWDVHYDFYQKDGKVKYGPLEPAYLEGMKTLVKWYKEGLIDPDYPILNRTTLDPKVLDDKVGAAYHFQPTNFMSKMKDKNPNFKIVGMPHLKGPNGQQGVFENSYSAAIYYPASTAITTAAKDPGEAMKWINYAFSEKGNMLFNFGIEGKSYEMKNGEPVYTKLITENPDGLSPTAALGKWTMAQNTWTMNQDVRYFRQMSINDYSRDAINTWKQVGDNSNKLVYGLSYTDEESAKISEKMAEINTYVDEMMDKYMLGKESLDNYNNFVAQLKKMGIEDIIKIQQAALDRYNK